MRIHVCFFLVIILSANKLFAQQKCPDTLQIDFSNLQKEYKCTVEYKKSQVIRIININRKIFEIEEGKVEKDFNTQVPGAFGTIKLPSFLPIGRMPRPSQAIHPAENLPADLKVADEATDPQEAIKAYFAEIKRRTKKLNEAAFLYNNINGLSKNCSLKANEVRDSLLKLTDIYLYGKPLTPVSGFATQQRSLKDTLQDMRIGAETILEHLTDIIEKYTAGINRKIKDDITTAETQIKEEQKILNERTSTSQQKENARKQITYFEKAQAAKQKELDEFSKTEKDLGENLEKAGEAIAAMYTFEKEDNIRNIVNAHSLLNHPNFFTYTAKLNKAKKDKTTYTFTVTPKELNECTKEDKKPIEVELLTKGGLKIDFSTGAFFNFGNEDFLGPSYYYKNLTDSTHQIVTADRGSQLMLSVGALMHFYQRTTNCVKIGGSLGVSTTADFETLNFHAGPSLIVGNESRFILTAGLTLKSSKLLDERFEVDKTYSTKETPDAVPTVNVFPKAGGFISITYNVSRFSKE